ncbi:MAG: mechanosensitive ion channel family protein [Deltaproteobacteria bacterium]|nr:mechanosensitive ion channel family protein [Deltaproteobacteria bacterium]
MANAAEISPASKTDDLSQTSSENNSDESKSEEEFEPPPRYYGPLSPDAALSYPNVIFKDFNFNFNVTVKKIATNDVINRFRAQAKAIEESIDKIVKKFSEKKNNIIEEAEDVIDRSRNRFNRNKIGYLNNSEKPAGQEELILRQISAKNRLNNGIIIIQAITDETDRIIANINSLRSDMSSYIFVAPDINRKLESSQNKLIEVRRTALNLLTNSFRLNADFEREINAHNAIISQNWTIFYLASVRPTLQLTGTLNLQRSFDSWINKVKEDQKFRRFYYPTSVERLINVILRFFVAMLMLSIMAKVLRDYFKSFRFAWSDLDAQKIVDSLCLCMVIGFSLLFAAKRANGGYYLILKIPGIIVVVWGLAALTWRLRLFRLHIRDTISSIYYKLSTKNSPLTLFYPAAVFGMMFLFLDVPVDLLVYFWDFILIVYLIWQFIFLKSKTLKTPLFFIERVSFKSSLYFAIVSLIVSVIGYPRLAILVFMLLFILVNIVTLASSLLFLVHKISQSYLKRKNKPMLNAFSVSLAIPLAICLSLVAAIPWIWAVPGLYHLLSQFFHKHYEFGSFTFEISRLFLIAFLFFFFRSLSNFGNTFFTHLPEKYSHLTSSLMRPLEILFVYLLWTIYIIIALAFLGFNFTSLAFIAGCLGAGFSIAFQSIISNFVSGLVIMFHQFIREGDMIEVDGYYGSVVGVNAQTTVIQTQDNGTIILPNSKIAAGKLVNYCQPTIAVRRALFMPVSYSVKSATILDILRKAAEEHNNVGKEGEDSPLATIEEFTFDTVIYGLYVTIDNIKDQIKIFSEIRDNIEKLLNEKGIDTYMPLLNITFSGSNSITNK